VRRPDSAVEKGRQPAVANRSFAVSTPRCVALRYRLNAQRHARSCRAAFADSASPCCFAMFSAALPAQRAIILSSAGTGWRERWRGCVPWRQTASSRAAGYEAPVAAAARFLRAASSSPAAVCNAALRLRRIVVTRPLSGLMFMIEAPPCHDMPCFVAAGAISALCYAVQCLFCYFCLLGACCYAFMLFCHYAYVCRALRFLHAVYCVSP